MPDYGGWEPEDFPNDDIKIWHERLVGVEKEHHTLQAKSRSTKAHIAKLVSAFANSRGGVLLVGVATEDDNDEITGIPGTDQ